MTNDFVKKFEKIVFITIFILLFVIVITFAFAVFYLMLKGMGIGKEVAGGIIGAVGGLIGGSLTLIGVWWTLNNQTRDKFVETFPDKYYKLEDISGRLLEIWKSFYLNSVKNSQEINDRVDEELRDVLMIASKVNGQVYGYVKEILLIVQMHKTRVIISEELHLYDDPSHTSLSEQSRQKRIDLMEITNGKFHNSYMKIDSYKNKLSQKYNKLMMINGEE